MSKKNVSKQTQDINQESKGFLSDLTEKDKPMLGETKLGKGSDREKHNSIRPNGNNRNERGSNH